MRRFSLAEQPFEVQQVRRALEDPAAGALCCFEGWVRDHHQGRAVQGLLYEAYPALAAAEGDRILDEAMARFDLLQVRCVHRVGELLVGELAVWVGASSAHRDAAFSACRFVIDEVKSRVPIWKHERYLDGAAEWLHPEPDRR
ncbi:MAG: molybdenum cofactor biosynthesis protein MoaE [Pseudomonadota bacterium]|nr:molybdenum cofactor biosynthesis protein MoaE [Pseudomonadota bacterium]